MDQSLPRLKKNTIFTCTTVVQYFIRNYYDGISSLQVISVIERRADQLDYVLVDTPGQIEIFTWSASGAIITEAFASTFPTVVAYVVDTPRSANPITFMSNMLYACSILYKTRLPMVLTFNKVDVAKHEFALEVLLRSFFF